MEWKDIILLIGVTVSLVIGVGNIVYNFIINRRTAFINAVTAERVKWIGKLREINPMSPLLFFEIPGAPVAESDYILHRGGHSGVALSA